MEGAVKRYDISKRKRITVEVHDIVLTVYGYFSRYVVSSKSFDWEEDADKYINDNGYEKFYINKFNKIEKQ